MGFSGGTIIVIAVLVSLASICRSHAATVGTCGISNLGYQCWLQVSPSSCRLSLLETSWSCKTIMLMR